jgi:hypothetical protein
MTPEEKKSYGKAYRAKNKEKLKEYEKKRAEEKKRYYEENKTAILARKKIYRQNNKEKIYVKNKEYQKINEEKIKQKNAVRRKIYYVKNIEKIKERYKNWVTNNREKKLALIAKRKAAQIQRTPWWITAEDWLAIQNFYAEAKRLEVQTGVKHHVDHIIPLQGKLVSGLHVPNNLCVISAKDNQRKSNNYQPN